MSFPGVVTSLSKTVLGINHVIASAAVSLLRVLVLIASISLTGRSESNVQADGIWAEVSQIAYRVL